MISRFDVGSRPYGQSAWSGKPAAMPAEIGMSQNDNLRIGSDAGPSK